MDGWQYFGLIFLLTIGFYCVVRALENLRSSVIAIWMEYRRNVGWDYEYIRDQEKGADFALQAMKKATAELKDWQDKKDRGSI